MLLRDITNLNAQTPPSVSDPSLSVKSHGMAELDGPDEIPSRSPSRLGFNRALAVKTMNVSNTLKWTHSLFQKIGDIDLEAYETAANDDDDSSASFSCSSSSSELDEDSGSDISESNSDEDVKLKPMLFPSPPTQPSFSTLSRSRSDSFYDPSKPPSSPPLPSPPTRLVSSASIRMNYAHHGHSRSSLMHQKWLWGVRYDEWTEWRAMLDESEAAADAYGGISIPPSTCPAIAPPRRTVQLDRDIPQQSPSCEPPIDLGAPIYPRMGDLSALHDPYSCNIDKCFYQLPLWSIQKALYLFDMHYHASTGKKLEPDIVPGDTTSSLEEQLGCTMCRDHTSPIAKPSSVSPVSSDEDTTLVDISSAIENNEDCIDDLIPWKGERPWEVSWYSRWELLIQLVKRDTALAATLPITPPRQPTRQVHPPKFYLADESSSEEGCFDDDDEDYGELVANPVFKRKAAFEVGFESVSNLGRDF